jgi:hypothetical protein
MTDTWFRGEAIDVAPATPGSTPPHDLGDGMYLTDSEASAHAYAELRTTNPNNRRVFSVQVDRSAMRVLDLTTDARWQQHVKPVEPILKTGTANENYGRTFENFVRVNKIDLSQYDAVIGHDYVRGGKQMCILHKGGTPSRLSLKIRGMFRLLSPVTTRVRSWMPRINLNTRAVRLSGLRGGMRTAGGIVVGLGIEIGLALLQYWMTKRMIEDKIKDGLKDLEPIVDAKIEKLKPDIAKLQLKLDKGEKVYANVTVQIHYIKKSLGGGKPSYIDPEVWLADVNITTRNITADRSFEKEYPITQKLLGGGESTRMYNRKVDEHTHSFEVEVFTQKELEHFADLSTEYLTAKRKMLMPPYNEKLVRDAHKLRMQIVHTFGSDVWFLDHSYDDYADTADSAAPSEADDDEPAVQKTSMRL